MNSTDSQIRQLTPADAASYREIRLAGLKNSPEAFDSTFEEENAQPMAWFCGRLDSSQVFGAFCSIELLGIAGFAGREGAKEAHKGQLWGMYVRPHARNAGVGRRLVEAVIEFSRRRVEVIQLAVVSDSAQARRLYTRLGFLEYGVERNSLKQGGRYYDAILMATDLAPHLCACHSSGSERFVVAGDLWSSEDSLEGLKGRGRPSLASNFNATQGGSSNGG